MSHLESRFADPIHMPATDPRSPADLSPQTVSPMRDWIAVEQLYQRMLGAAEDDFERDVLRLAAERCGGPDPGVAGGGEAWQEAVAQARTHLQAVQALPEPTAPAPTAQDTQRLRAAIAAAVANVDGLAADETAQQAIAEAMQALLSVEITVGKHEERTQVARWLGERAEQLTAGGASVVVQAQANALAAAAQALRR